MSDTETAEPRQSQTAARPVGVVRLFFQEISRLFRSRTSLLREYYSDAIAKLGGTVTADMGLRELRDSYYHHLLAKSASQVRGIEEQERHLVIVSRCSSIWMVFWLAILPAALASCGVHLLAENGEHLVARACGFALVWVLVFPILAFVGLLVQSLLTKPFVAVLNWWLRSKTGADRS